MMGYFFNKMGWSENDKGWTAEITSNPHEFVQNSFFAWNLIILSLYYLFVTIKNRWDINGIKKGLSNWVYDGIEK